MGGKASSFFALSHPVRLKTITKEAIKGRIIVLMVDTFYHIN